MYRHADQNCWMYNNKKKIKASTPGMEFVEPNCNKPTIDKLNLTTTKPNVSSIKNEGKLVVDHFIQLTYYYSSATENNAKTLTRRRDVFSIYVVVNKGYLFRKNSV